MLSSFVRGEDNVLSEVFKKAGTFHPELYNSLGDVRDTLESTDPHGIIIKKFGVACPNPGAFLSA